MPSESQSKKLLIKRTLELWTKKGNYALLGEDFFWLSTQSTYNYWKENLALPENEIIKENREFETAAASDINR